MILICIVLDICDSQYYSYSLPSGYVSFYRPPSKLSQHLVYNVAYSPYSNYNNYQHRTIAGNSNYAGRYYRYRTSPQLPINSSNSQATNNHAKRTDVSAKPLPSPNGTTANAITTDSNSEKLKQEAEKGFKLLGDLLETVTQAAGTAKNSDITEVDAVKSIFSDVIDEVIRQVERRFKENNLDTRISDAFVWRSKTTKKFLNEALNQEAIAAILKPYLTDLRDLTYKGFESAT